MASSLRSQPVGDIMNQKAHFETLERVLSHPALAGLPPVLATVILWIKSLRAVGSPSTCATRNRDRRIEGFTLIELLLILGLLAVLLSLVVTNLFGVVAQASIDTSVTLLVSDLKQQQTKAMIGESDGASTSRPYGAYFEPKRYVLFRGASFSADDSFNFVIDLPSSLAFTDIASAQAVFQKGSGEIAGFTEVTLQDSVSGLRRRISTSKFGVMRVE